MIGQLKAVSADSNRCDDQTAFYGKFSKSWNNGIEARRRLRDWLDPDGINYNYIDGTYCTGIRYITNTNFDVNNVIYGCTINMQNVMVRNGANVTFNAANDVVINGAFEVELGSAIEIK